jgi:hypothetical protein
VHLTFHPSPRPVVPFSANSVAASFATMRSCRVEGKPRRITLGHFPKMTTEQARRKALSRLEAVENRTFGKMAAMG